MCVYTKTVTVALQAVGSKRGWDGVREKGRLESSAPATSFEHHNQYRAASVFKMLQKCLRLENVENNREWLYLVVAYY